MSLISKEEAHSTFKPFFPVFNSVFDDVWKNWLSNDVARRMVDKRVRAAFIRNDSYYFLKDAITDLGLKDIKYIKVPHQTGFLVCDNYFVRIKKGDKSYRSSNYPTQSALDFHDPDVDMFGGLIRLELLYILDDDGVGIDKLVLTQRNGKYVAWAIDVSAENVVEFVGNDIDKEIQRTAVGYNHQDAATAANPPAKSVIRRKNKPQEKVKAQNDRDG